MRSLPYYVSKIPGARRGLKWVNQKKIQGYRKIEDQRKNEDPLNLRNFERRVFSQNGEDGILQEIFNRIGRTNSFFVEFGIEDGTECNGRYLLEELGWSGLWLEGSSASAAAATSQFSNFPIVIKEAMIQPDNVEKLFTEGGVPKSPDLLSIDIDGNDFWVWKAIEQYDPRVVAIEYNARFLATEEWIMPYDAQHRFDGSANYGASLLSYEKLGAEKGYTLVTCDSMGVNAFFVKTDLIDSKFSHIQSGSSYHYCCPKYRGLFFGHPW